MISLRSCCTASGTRALQTGRTSCVVCDAIQAAYDQLVDRVCPCVLLVHSQSGAFKSNSHFPMMKKNNAEVAEVVHKWLASKGLVD